MVVASGTFGRTPYVPDFADQLDPGILKPHSSAYKSPAQLRPGRDAEYVVRHLSAHRPQNSPVEEWTAAAV